MFNPCGRGNCLLKEAVIEDFQTLSIKCGKMYSQGWVLNSCQSTFGRLKSPISQIFDDVCFTISKHLLSSSRLYWSNLWGLYVISTYQN